MAREDREGWLERNDRKLLVWFRRALEETSGPLALGVRSLLIFYLAARNSVGDRLPFLANGLTFITLLGMVPALAISFSVAKGLGFASTLRDLVTTNELVVGQREVVESLLNYVERTNVGTLGAIGTVSLIVTLVFTLSSVEDTFNRIWQVAVQRSWLRRFTDYLAVLIILPLVALAATGMWAAFTDLEVTQWFLSQTGAASGAAAAAGGGGSEGLGFGPVAILSLFFMLMYLVMPNTRVPIRSALLAGVVAGLLWWAVQTAYVAFQIGVARFNAIYGGFASLPLFMIWIQVSWTVVLFGAELAHAHFVCQGGVLPRALQPSYGPAQREALGLKLMHLVSLRFHHGQAPLDATSLAHELAAPAGEVNRVLVALEDCGLVVRVEDSEGIQPGRSLEALRAGEVLKALRGPLTCGADEIQPMGEPALDQWLERVAEAGQVALGEVTLLDLVRDSDPPAEAGEAAA